MFDWTRRNRRTAPFWLRCRAGWHPGRVLPLLALLLILLGSRRSAFSAGNQVPITAAVRSTFSIAANDLRPPECALYAYSDVLVVSGIYNAPDNNELILGSPGADTINGKRGSDCIVGGDGNDRLDGDKESDVLIGGPGDDYLDGGQGDDICIGGPGNDTFKFCETIID